MPHLILNDGSMVEVMKEDVELLVAFARAGRGYVSHAYTMASHKGAELGAALVVAAPNLAALTIPPPKPDPKSEIAELRDQVKSLEERIQRLDPKWGQF